MADEGRACQKMPELRKKSERFENQLVISFMASLYVIPTVLWVISEYRQDAAISNTDSRKLCAMPDFKISSVSPSMARRRK